MRLRGVDFGPIWGASGVQGFFGEGYWYHQWLGWLGLDFSGMTFVAKTTTVDPRVGNMSMRSDGTTPRDLFPDCINVRPLKGVALNSVGLSGPGLMPLLYRGEWQRRREPFCLSFMSLAQTPRERADQLREFVDQLGQALPSFQARIALQLNFSCPNVGMDPLHLIGEIDECLRIAAQLGIPLIPKLNVLAPPAIVRDLEAHTTCDGFCVSNTLPWGTLPDRIDWKRLWPGGSPLNRHGYGNGGLSGHVLFPLVREWVQEARRHSPTFPINAGGGILKPDDAITLLQDGANSVFIGSMAFLRPWNVEPTIRAVHAWTKQGKS